MLFHLFLRPDSRSIRLAGLELAPCGAEAGMLFLGGILVRPWVGWPMVGRMGLGLERIDRPGLGDLYLYFAVQRQGVLHGYSCNCWLCLTS
jgi:hypothetical protein